MIYEVGPSLDFHNQSHLESLRAGSEERLLIVSTGQCSNDPCTYGPQK